MLAIFKRELQSFFFGISVYVICAVSLLVTALFLWFFDGGFNVLNYGYADLGFYFDLSPWIFILIIPALTMGSFSEEYRLGTFDLLRSRPISILGLFFAKYLATLSVVACCIFPTLCYYFTMHKLGGPPGNIDSGGTMASYLGLWLVCCVFTVIGLFSSSLSKSQITAFISGVFVCFIFLFGFEGLASYNLLGDWDYTLKQFGIDYHYKSIRKGVVDTRSLTYFTSVIAFFCVATIVKIKSLKW